MNTRVGQRAVITIDDLGMILDMVGDEIDVADEGDAPDSAEELYKQLARLMRRAEGSPAGVDHLMVVTTGDY
jgi:hypothetical protein